jgi:hypothetical protein
VGAAVVLAAPQGVSACHTHSSTAGMTETEDPRRRDFHARTGHGTVAAPSAWSIQFDQVK